MRRKYEIRLDSRTTHVGTIFRRSRKENGDVVSHDRRTWRIIDICYDQRRASAEVVPVVPLDRSALLKVATAR